MKPSAHVFANLTVDLGERSYPIVIGSHLLQDAEFARHVPGKRIAIVTNTTVAPLYLARLTAMLEAAGKQCFAVILPDTPGDAAIMMANAMCRKVRDLRIPHQRPPHGHALTLPARQLPRLAV